MTKVLVLCVGLLAAGIAAAAEPAKVVGCSVSYDAYLDEMARAYARKTGRALETVRAGVPVAVAAALNRKAALGTGCRHVTAQERGKGAVETIIGYDMLVILVHPSNPIENLTLEQVRRVFAGQITDWGELGGVKGRPIMLVGRESEGAGVTVSFQEMVMKGLPLSDKRLARVHSGQIEGEIETNPYGIAVSGLSARRRAVKLLRLEGAPPDGPHFRDGSYPLARPLFAVTRGRPEGLAQDFIAFMLSAEGQAVMGKNAYTLADWEARRAARASP